MVVTYKPATREYANKVLEALGLDTESKISKFCISFDYSEGIMRVEYTRDVEERGELLEVFEQAELVPIAKCE